MDTSRILSFGISLAGGGVLEVRYAVRRSSVSRDLTAPLALQPPGPFQLELQRIRARNTAVAGKKAFV